MKREFLKGLGISEELVESIMAEHGKTVEASKTEAETLRRTGEEMKKQLVELFTLAFVTMVLSSIGNYDYFTENFVH